MTGRRRLASSRTTWKSATIWTGQRQLLEGRPSRLTGLNDLVDLGRREYMKSRAELQAVLVMLNVPEEQAILQAGEYLESLAGCATS